MRLVVPIEMPDTMGGMLASVELLLRFLPGDIEKVVFLPRDNPNAERMRAAGASIVYSGSKAWHVDRDRPIRTLESFFRFRRDLRPLLVPGSVLLTNNIAAELLCGLGGYRSHVPRVFVNRGDEYRGTSARALRNSLRTCSACVATTPYQRQTLVTTLGVDPERIRLIPNGVETADLDGAKSAPKPSWYEEGKIHVATIGFPSQRKNQELLIRSVALLRGGFPQLRGVIIGSPGSEPDERYLASLKSLVDALDLKREIRFVPFIKDRKEMLSGVDILASTAIREGFGRTIIEAMAAGCPVVALRAGGPETIIEEGLTGLLVSENAPEAFAKALKTMIEDTSFREGLIGNAQAACRSRYDAAAVAAGYLSLFQECLSHRDEGNQRGESSR